MPIVRHSHKRDYTVIDNKSIQDNRLSFGSRGLHHLMLSLPDDWEFSQKWLEQQAKEGRISVRRYVAELIEYGYIDRRKERIKGRFKTVWDIREFSNSPGVESNPRPPGDGYRPRSTASGSPPPVTVPNTKYLEQSTDQQSNKELNTHDPERVHEKNKPTEPDQQPSPVNPTNQTETPKVDKRVAGDKNSAARFENNFTTRMQLPPWRTGYGVNDWKEEILQGYIKRGLQKGWKSCDRADAVGYFANCEKKSRAGEAEEFEKAVAMCEEIQRAIDSAGERHLKTVPTISEMSESERQDSLAELQRVKATRELVNAS